MDQDFAPNLPQPKKDKSEKRPVSFKALSKDPAERLEQIEKIIAKLVSIDEEISKPYGDYSKIRDTDAKLNYYLINLNPQDRMDVLKSLAIRDKINFNTFTRLIQDNTSYFRDTELFPEVKTERKMFRESDIKDMERIIKGKDLQTYIRPQMFDQISQPETIEFFFKEMNKYGLDIEKNHESLGLSPFEIVERYYQIIQNDFELREERLNNFREILYATRNYLSEQDTNYELTEDNKEEIKKIISFCIEKHNSDNLNIFMKGKFDDDFYHIFKLISNDYEKFGYTFDELVSEISKLGPTHLISQLINFKDKDLRQHIISTSLSNFELLAQESEYYKYRIDLRGVGEFDDILYTPIDSLSYQLYTFDNLRDLDLIDVYKFLLNNPNILYDEYFFKYVLKTNNLQLLEYFLYHNENNRAYTYLKVSESKLLSLDEKEKIQTLLKDEDLGREIFSFNISPDRIIEILRDQSSRPSNLKINSILEFHSDKFSPDQIMELLKLSFENQDLESIVAILNKNLIILSEELVSKIRDLIIQNSHTVTLIQLFKLDNNLLERVIDMSTIIKICLENPSINYDLILTKKDLIKDFDFMNLFELALMKGDLENFDNYLNSGEISIGLRDSIKQKVFQNIENISDDNNEFIIDWLIKNKALSPDETEMILSKINFTSFKIMSIVINETYINNINEEVLNHHIKNIVNGLESFKPEQDNEKHQFILKMLLIINDIYKRETNLITPDYFKNFIDVITQKLTVNKKLTELNNEEIVRSLQSFQYLPQQLKNKLNLGFDASILYSVSKIPSNTQLNDSISTIMALHDESSPHRLKSEYDNFITNLESNYNHHGKDIPLEIFIQLASIVDFNLEEIKKLNEVFSLKLGKKNQDNLTSVIINCSNMYTNRANPNTNLKNILKNEILNLKNKEKNQITEAISAIKLLTVTDSFGNMSDEDILEFNRMLENNSNSFSETVVDLILLKYKEIFPDIEAGVMYKLIEFYGDIEPILTYAKGLDGLEANSYLQEILNNMNPGNTQAWKDWRYDLQNPTVVRQLEILNPDEINLWSQDKMVNLEEYYSEIKIYDKLISDARKDLVSYIERLIQNPEIQNNNFTNELFNKILELTSANYSIDELLNEINKLQSEINIQLRYFRNLQSFYNNTEKSKKYFDTLFEQDSIKLSEKNFQLLELFLKKIVSNEDLAIKRENFYRELNKTQNREPQSIKLRDNIISAEIIEKITNYFKAEEENFNISESKLRVLGFETSKDSLNSISSQFEFAQNLLSLLTITSDEIKNGKFNRESSKQEIKTVISKVIKYLNLEDSKSFERNLQLTLSKQDTAGENIEVITFITDNPYILLNIGKYPIGNGSCQNYENDGLNRALMGYIGDASTKGVLVLQLNKLSLGLQQKIKSDGVDSLLNTKFEREILDAIIGRSIIKLTSGIERDSEGREIVVPGIYIEPTYTIVNKLDNSQNELIADAVIDAYARDLGLAVYRGSGGTMIQMKNSRNPEGQYEDGGAGGANHAGLGIQTDDYQFFAERIY